MATPISVNALSQEAVALKRKVDTARQEDEGDDGEDEGLGYED